MKEVKVKKLSLIILSIVLLMCIITSVYAVDLVDITSNTSGSTNTTGQNTTTGNTQNITSIEQPTFKDVNETVYATATVNVKSSYTASSTNISTLTKDQSVKRTGVGTGTNGWSRIQMSNGQIGYVETSYLTTIAPTTNTNTSITPTNNTSVYGNTSNTLPTTGIESNPGAVVLMIACVVIAIYAYKKIRDYNV